MLALWRAERAIVIFDMDKAKAVPIELYADALLTALARKEFC